MEWENKEEEETKAASTRAANNPMIPAGDNHSTTLFVKVMTDEQLETLRKQIAVYAAICEQLVDLHKTLSAQHDISSGGRLGGMYGDPLIASGGQKITARQRWTPTPLQLQILERIFEQGNGTPSKKKIKDITSELSQHGQISETNVYNWFQNRRARSKRKQMVASCNNANNAATNCSESEAEVEVDSLNEIKTKPEIDLYYGQRADELCFHSPEISSELHFLDVLQNPRDEHLIGEDYGLSG